jgi:membrane associated rhomboid family serine protease
VYCLWHGVSPSSIPLLQEHLLVSNESLASLRIWTLLTAEFSHIDSNHLLFNLVGLYVFGQSIEQALGSRNLLHLYCAGAVVASLGHIAYGLVTGDPAPALGASGAVMALAFVYAALFPDRQLLLMFILPVRAWAAVGLFVVVDVMGMMSPPGTSTTAHAAHLGGLAYGALFYATWIRPRLVS